MKIINFCQICKTQLNCINRRYHVNELICNSCFTKRKHDRGLICRICKIELNNDNKYNSQNHDYICKNCRQDKSRLNYLINREQILDYQRKNIIHSKDNKQIIGNKRPFTNICEICGIKKEKIAYHHWNDKHVEWGIWCCSSCHFVFNILEKFPNISEKYFNLKDVIQNEI